MALDFVCSGTLDYLNQFTNLIKPCSGLENSHLSPNPGMDNGPHTAPFVYMVYGCGHCCLVCLHGCGLLGRGWEHLTMCVVRKVCLWYTGMCVSRLSECGPV